ncbi:MFS transporter [Saccharopolyspora hattusasensis]|uniref:MFS transporter n=1 Tax=Saccharopolyspora hattusasensis TaxID=1128679 RepID=UPI003D956103
MYVEDLCVVGLGRTRLAKSVHDAGWAAFTSMVEYKAARYGRTFGRVDRYFPSTRMCSACERINDKTAPHRPIMGLPVRQSPRPGREGSEERVGRRAGGQRKRPWSARKTRTRHGGAQGSGNPPGRRAVHAQRGGDLRPLALGRRGCQFNPILTEVTGFSPGAVPLLLVAYGAATVVSNTIVGRLADRYTIAVLLCGLVLNLGFLPGFALLADVSVPAVVFMLGIGLVGVTMNPATITRVQRTGNAPPLVKTVHSSFITLGVMIGSWIGELAISNFGLRAPLWLGAALAAVGIVTLLPDLIRRRAAAPEAAPAPSLAETA